MSSVANLFIHPENQTLLWNLLQESPYWKSFSATVDTHTWFRDIIRAMHELHPSVPTIDELKRVNSEMVAMCSKRMKTASHGNSEEPTFDTQIQMPQTGTTLTLAQAYDVEKQREANLAAAKAEFDEFQNRYNKGLERPTPPVLNLAINLDEPKITDMEQLVKQHLDSRNSLQIPAWNPAPQTQTYELLESH